MREQEINEGLGDLAHAAEKDHEVQMARAELYKLAKYAIKLHDILKGVSEAEGLEGWVQSKITKSAEMVGSVYHHMDYKESDGDEMSADALDNMKESKDTHCSDKCCGADVKAEDCTCKPSCAHCNCNSVNETLSPEDKKLVDKMYNKDGTLTAIGKKVMDHGKKDKKPAVKEAKKKMVKDPKTGKMVPDYAADGKGKNDLKKESLPEGELSEGPFKGVGKALMKRKLNKQYKKSDLANFDKSGIDTRGKTPDEIGDMKSDYYHGHMDKADRLKKAKDRLSRKKKPYKESLQDRLAAKLAESACCSDCGNPSYKSVSEEKKKGSHGKVCWKGFRRGKGDSCHRVKGDG